MRKSWEKYKLVGWLDRCCIVYFYNKNMIFQTTFERKWYHILKEIPLFIR